MSRPSADSWVKKGVVRFRKSVTRIGRVPFADRQFEEYSKGRCTLLLLSYPVGPNGNQKMQAHARTLDGQLKATNGGT